MKLVPNWQKALTWYSTQANGIGLALLGAWVAMPSDLKDKLPEQWIPYVAIAAFALGFVGRLVDQSKQEDK